MSGSIERAGQNAVGLIALVFSVMLAGGCTSTPYAEETIQDPFEPINRVTFAFNLAFDKHIIQPVTGVYKDVAPRPVQDGMHNFFNNAASPHVVANDVLQLNLGQALSDTARLALNTTVGLGGLFDPASDIGLTQNDENFGVTAAKWGIDEGPYIVLPFFGPHTVSSIADIPLRVVTNPILFVNPVMFRLALNAADAVSTAADKESGRKQVQQSLSPYAFMRNAYYQRQRSLIQGSESSESPPAFQPLPLDDLDLPPDDAAPDGDAAESTKP